MRTPTPLVSALALVLASPMIATAAPRDLSGDGAVSVVDGVAALRAGDDADARRTLRRAAGLAARSSTRGAPRGIGSTSRPVRFHLETAVAFEGFHLEVSYPLAKGGFVGSADGVACSTNGGGFFIANDRDDGTMALIEASAFALSFPIDITCLFEEAPGESLAAADLGITIVEVVEGGAPGDPAELLVTVGLEGPPICSTGQVRVTSRAGGVLDPGWTGLYHASPLPAGAELTLPVGCGPAPELCPADALTSTPVGPPLPLSAAGVAVCVLSSFREPPSGYFDCGIGCAALHLPLLSRVFLVGDLGSPCPPCVGDPAPNDGIKGGTCSGGTTPGAACDVGGTVASFDAAGPDFGHTSLDCLPTGSSVGELDVDLDPLTTATSTLTASETCVDAGHPAGSCHCPGQRAPHPCLDGVCPASGVCEAGPIDGVCDGQSFRHCRSGTGTEDCEDVFPGAGSCVDQPRPCFGSIIERSGTCGVPEATMVSTFCLPPTRSAAVNVTMGLPGPAALALPIHLSAAPRPILPACSDEPASGCRALAPDHQSILLLKDHPRGDDELAWRWLGGEATATSDFGRPDLDTDVGVCVYTPAASGAALAFAACAPAGSLCGVEPCWQPTAKGGFVYRDPTATNAGLTRIELTPGPEGKSRIIVKGRGPNLPLPALPLGGTPLVQVQASNGNCWEATFGEDDLMRNDGKRVRAITRR